MKSVFFISDRTGITTEAIGNALLTQFDNVIFRKELVPFIDTDYKADQVIMKINARFLQDGQRPIIITSIINPLVRDKFKLPNVFHMDFFESFIPSLEMELGQKASLAVGKSHGISNENQYNNRIDAIHFSLENDDGASVKNYDKADVILVGVSRVGKTPTCVYLAVNYGIRAANYPFAEIDLRHEHLPKSLVPYHNKLFGLTIDAEKLHHIRTNRLANTHYSSLDNCKYEVIAAENMMRQCGVPFLDTSKKSIEEISVAIMHQIKLVRKF